MLIKHIISAIEEFAPLALQEKWDNTGLQVGDPSAECSGVLLCLDVSESVVAEAVERGCNLVVSHHPLLFRGLKRITGATPSERCVLAAIKYGVAIYSSHTALDSAVGGVSNAIAQSIGAKVERVLHPSENGPLKLVVYTPRHLAEDVRAAIADAADEFGGGVPVVAADAVKTESTRTEDADGVPMLELNHTPYASLSMTISSERRREVESVLSGMGDEITYQFIRLSESDSRTGLGVVARFDKPIALDAFMDRVKSACGADVLRCSELPFPDAEVQRVAVCGGSGGEFISDAVRAGADAYITADVRYHDFAEWGDRILIVDAGHYETESCTKTLFMQLIKEKFANFAVYISATEKNPINYL